MSEQTESRSWRLPGRHPEDRAIGALAIPALGALAADPLYSLVDTAYVGQLGVPQLAGLAIGVAAFTASFWIFSFLAYGVTPRVAGALGAARPDEARGVGLQALYLAFFLGGVMALLGWLFAGSIVVWFGASDEVARFAEPYLRIRALAAVPVLIAQVGQGFLRGTHDTRTPTYVVVAGALANVIVGYLFIFPFGWGIEGAAWAVVICQGAVAIAFIAILRRRMGVGSWRPDLATMRSLLRVGGELALRTGSLLAGLTIATALAARIGTTSVAAWQIAMQVWLLLSLTIDAVAIAAQTMVASHLGAGEVDRAREVGNRLVALGGYVGLMLAVVVGLFAPVLAEVFTDSERVVSLGTGLLIWIGLLQPIGALAFTLDGILIGASDTGFLALAMVGVTAVFILLMLVFFTVGIGLWGIATAMSVWLFLRAATTWWRFRGSGWLNPRLA